MTMTVRSCALVEGMLTSLGPQMVGLLCFEVDKPSKILIKILNVVEYIESNIQNIEAPTTNDPII